MNRERSSSLVVRGLLAGVMIASVAVGCGDDSLTSSGNDGLLINVKNGTWEVLTTFPGATGPDSCLNRLPDTTFVDTLVICSFNPVDPGTNLPVFIRCQELTFEGTTVNIDCRAGVDLAPCFIVQNIMGTGTILDTTFTIAGFSWVTIESDNNEDLSFCQALYAHFADVCSTQYIQTGTWLSADTGTEVCAPDAAGAGTTSFQDLFGRTAARTLNVPE